MLVNTAINLLYYTIHPVAFYKKTTSFYLYKTAIKKPHVNTRGSNQNQLLRKKITEY